MPAGSASRGSDDLLTLRTENAGHSRLLFDGIVVTADLHPSWIDLTVSAKVRGRTNTHRVQLLNNELPYSVEAMSRKFPTAVDAAMFTHRSALLQLLRARVEIETPGDNIVLKEAGDATALMHGETMMAHLGLDPDQDLEGSFPAPDGLTWRSMNANLAMTSPELDCYPSVIHLTNMRKAIKPDWYALIGSDDRFLGALVLWKDVTRPSRKPPHMCGTFMPCLMTCRPLDDLFQSILQRHGQVIVGLQREGYLLREYHLDLEPDESISA